MGYKIYVVLVLDKTTERVTAAVLPHEYEAPQTKKTPAECMLSRTT